MKNIAQPLLVLALTSVGLAADKVRQSQTDDIREAVFRWQFDHNAFGMQKKAQAYFLEVGEKGGDQADDFLKRFTDHKPPVRKVSACTASADKGVLDKKDGREGPDFSRYAHRVEVRERGRCQRRLL